uniref:Candidate secreted effector n=1 Tax=Meloidogyne incognita TaxID=6306 RepID=A0A914MUF0_MELIC
MTKITAKTVLRHSLYFLIFLLFLLATTNAGNVRRYHRHHQQQQQKKAIQDDYDITDYSSGVFVDRVPIVSDTSSSTSTRKTSHNYSKTNRYTNIPSKLRKFREDINDNNNDSVERKRWLQELFVQKKKAAKF